MASSIIVFLFAALLTVAYFSRRRYGILALGLCAGTLLSQYFTGAASALIESQGVQLVAPPLGTVVGIGLTLVPVLFLLTSGPAYGNKRARLLGGILFAVLGSLFLIPVLKASLASDLLTQQFFFYAGTYGPSVTAILILWAVVDTMLATGRKAASSHDHH